MAVFNNFEVVDQTQAINLIPRKPGLLGALGLFREETVSTDAVSFDVRENTVAILDDHLRNVAQKNSTEDAPFNIHTLAIPHYPIEKVIGREKLAGVRGFGQEGEQMIAAAVAEELEKQALRHDVHEEYLKAAMAIKGEVVTTHYGTFNMATEFGFTQPQQVIEGSAVAAGLRAAMQKSRDGLRTGGRVAGYIALVGAEMFEHIIASEDVEKAYQFSQAGGNPLRMELGEVANGYTLFRWGNIDVVLYDDTFQDKEGNTITILGDEEGVLIPRTEIGRVFYGPASTLSGLGKYGDKRFARSWRDPKDRFVEVESEQSTLVINEQWEAVVNLQIG